MQQCSAGNTCCLFLAAILLVAAGLLLTVSEIFIGSFVVLWFGVGALFSGLLTLLFPELHAGVQALVAALSGTGMMFLFRSRLISEGNAEEDELYTFTGGTGVLRVSDAGQLSVSSKGTYWRIFNPEVIPEEARRDGLKVAVHHFEDNQAVLYPFALPREPLPNSHEKKKGCHEE